MRSTSTLLALRASFPVLAPTVRPAAAVAAAAGTAKHEETKDKKPAAPASGVKTHVMPEVILRDLTNTISRSQKAFLAGGADGVADTYSEAFFGIVNNAYESKMQHEQQTEVESYVAKRRAHYDQRLNEETEEFRRERREVHDELQRIECDKYKVELVKDVAEFAAQRQKDCEMRLKKDIDKYHAALQSYRAKQTQKSAEKPGEVEFDDLEKDLLSDISATVDQLEADTQLFDFGPGAKGFGNDLTADDISGYVDGRLRFYERTLQEEIDFFTHRRRSFYEELIQARAVRHAAKIRSDTEKFRAKRAVYYKDKLAKDAIWMAKSFQGHYERCILSCYARQAWLMHRMPPAPNSAAFGDASKMSFEQLNQQLPLSNILKIYAAEAIEEISRDVFLKAANRIAKDPITQQAPKESSSKKQ